MNIIEKISAANRKRKIKRHTDRDARKYTKEIKEFKEAYPKCMFFEDTERGGVLLLQ